MVLLRTGVSLCGFHVSTVWHFESFGQEVLLLFFPDHFGIVTRRFLGPAQPASAFATILPGSAWRLQWVSLLTSLQPVKYRHGLQVSLPGLLEMSHVI